MFIEEHRHLFDDTDTELASVSEVVTMISISHLTKQKDSEVLGVPGKPNGGAAPLLSESGYSLSDIYNHVNPCDARFLNNQFIDSTQIRAIKMSFN